MSFSKTTLISLLIFPSVAVAQNDAEESKFQFSVTAGIVSLPNFLGDDDQQILAVPDITISYGDRFTASLGGVRYTVFDTPNLHFGVVGAYGSGRPKDPQDDNPFLIKGGDTSDLDGLDDIDGTVELGMFIAHDYQNLRVKAEIRKGVDGGHDGVIGEAEVTYTSAISDTMFVTVGPAVAFGNAAYNGTFFDVTAAQSAASGLSQYDADGGIISVGLHGSAIIALCETTSLIGFAKFDRLADEIGNSSIVAERGAREQVSAGLLVNYTF